MAKRFVTIFFIVIAIAIFLVVGFFAVLFLAPGFEAFGLKYIMLGARKYDSGQVLIIDEMNKLGYESFSGTVIVESDEVPVEIEFTESYSYTVRYYEDYSGLTKTDIDYPSLSITRDNLGNAVVKVTGFETWIFENSNTKRYLKIGIPINSTGTSTSSNKASLKIVSKNSDIVFNKETELDTRTPYFYNVEIETNGKITYNTPVKATTYKLTTNNSIVLDKDCSNAVQATNYELHSLKGRVTVNFAISGNLTASTKNFDIRLISCTTLTAESYYGDIVCADKNSVIELSGMAFVSTKTGAVKLGKVSGGSENKITTTSGDVEIKQIKNATITTKRGSVTIDSVSSATISTDIGKVKIEEILTNAKIKTVRGSVELGGTGMMVNNPTVESTFGRVTLHSASGKVDVLTTYNDVSFTNTNSENIKIVSGGKLNAKGLTGLVELDIAEDSEVEFTEITEDVSIKLGDKCKTFVLWAVEDSVNDTEFAITGKTIVRYEDNDNGTGTYSKVQTAQDGITNRLTGTEPYLKITSKNANISIYFKTEIQN